MQFDTPVLFLVFNRPDTTEQVFERIREIQPRQLFIAADGPRDGKEGEKEKCEEVKQLIMKGIDWPCEVKTLFREKNLGCGLAVSGAITWFFEYVEEGIILEDDTLPDLSFFNFCSVLLKKYKNDLRIWQIGGICHYPSKSKYSYYFSSHSHIWGWATWRRSWKKYDFYMNNIDRNNLEKNLEILFSTKNEKKYWLIFFETLKNLKNKTTWDYQWAFSMWNNKSLSILPTTNLVSNIGFGSYATHTFSINSEFANVPSSGINQIIFNDKVEINTKADLFTSKKVFGINSNGLQLLKKYKSLVKGFLIKR